MWRMSIVGYARVSTAEQNTDGQLDLLTGAGCERTFVGKASGKLIRRPQLDAMLEYVRPGDIVITKLDRLGRPVAHLVELAAPVGRLTLHILASIAEFERDLISERIREGPAAARARGRKGGRRRCCRRPRPSTRASCATAASTP